MITKILMGVSAASLLALGLVFWLLLGAKEANGILQQGISQAEGVNNRQAATLVEVRENHINLLKQIEQQRLKTKAATDALAKSRKGLVAARADFDRRIRLTLDDISDEDLECASEFVPQPLIDSLTAEAAVPP